MVTYVTQRRTISESVPVLIASSLCNFRYINSFANAYFYKILEVSLMNKSFLYRTLHRIPCDVFEKCSAIIFFILIFWPALYSALYYNHYDYWIPLFSIAYWDTGALALILVLVYIAKNVITNPGWLKNTFHSHLWAWFGLLLLLWITLCSLLAKDWSVALNGSGNRCEVC